MYEITKLKSSITFKEKKIYIYVHMLAEVELILVMPVQCVM